MKLCTDIHILWRLSSYSHVKLTVAAEALVSLHIRGSAKKVKSLWAIYCVRHQKTCSVQSVLLNSTLCCVEGDAGITTEEACPCGFAVSACCRSAGVSPFSEVRLCPATREATGRETNPFTASRSHNDMQTLLCDSFPVPIWMFYELLGDIGWHTDTRYSAFWSCTVSKQLASPQLFICRCHCWERTVNCRRFFESEAKINFIVFLKNMNLHLILAQQIYLPLLNGTIYKPQCHCYTFYDA